MNDTRQRNIEDPQYLTLLQKGDAAMRVFSLFELYLIVFTIYAISEFEGALKILVPCLCFFSDFLFVRFKKRFRESPRGQV